MASATKKIGTLLVQRGLLTQEQFDSCLREHASGAGGTLSEIILSRGYASPERLTRTLNSIGAMTLRCPEGCGPLSVPSVRLDAPYSCAKCGAALEAEETPAAAWKSTAESELPAEVTEASRDPKRRLGKYILVKELGRGGSGSVYQAWDSILGQFVALKLIVTTGDGFAEDRNSKEVQEFLREARTAVRLSHPNIVRVYEVGCQDGRYYLSMELIEGGSLAKLIHGKDASRRPLFYADPARFLTILRDVARALDYAHHQKPPIVHRDVKPHNILVDSSGRACLADFGLAREIGGAGRLTVTGVAKGTPCYMAPEQAKIHGGALDGRTDVYGLGAILYECLAGTPPFTGSSSHEILQKVISEDAPPPSQVLRSRNVPTVAPEALERIAFKALEKNAKDRYAGAAEFAADLERYLKGKDVAATGISPATRGVRWVARRRSIALPVAIAVVMAIVALVATLRGGKERVVERVVVQKEKVVEVGVESRLAEVDALAAELRFSDALQKCARLRGETKDAAVLARLAQMEGDLRLEQEMLTGLVDRIRIQPRDYLRFTMGGTTMARVQVAGASMDHLTIVAGGLRTGYPWSSVDPKQFVQLVRDYWPGLDGRPALGLALWARRHRVDATAKAAPAESGELQYFKLLSEAERALADGALVSARDRFEAALEANRDGREAKDGLERVAAAERKKAAERPPVAVKPPEPPAVAAPKPAATKNEQRAEEQYKKGNQFFEDRDYRSALAMFTSSMSYATKQGNAFAMRGYCRYMLGEWIPARGDLTAAVSAGTWNDDYPQLFLWIISARLGEKAAATEELRAYTAKGLNPSAPHAAWFRSVSSYLTNDLQEAGLLQSTKETSGAMKQIEKECEAFFYIGARNLVEGRKAAARKWFQKCLDTEVTAYFEHKAAEAELERLGPGDDADPAPAVQAPEVKPAALKAGALPPPPPLAGNERLILTVPQVGSWQLLSIAPGGAEAAYKESKPGGKTSVVWKNGRLDNLDRVENLCLWKDGRFPVLKVEIDGKEHVTDGSDLHEGFSWTSMPILSPNRQSVAFVAKDAAQTYVVAHGEKSTVLETWEASLAYTPGNQVVYNATVSTSTGGTMSGWFVDRSPIKLQGIGSSTVMPPTFTADAAHAAYSIGEAICVDGVYGPQFYRVFSPRFSADGRVIAYVAEISTGGGGASRTKKAVVVGSTPGTRYDDIAGSPLLSSDGRVLAYIAKRGQKWLVVHGTKTGEEFDAIPTRLYDVDQPVMSSDGKILAYTAERGGQKVVVVNGKEVDNQPNLGAPAISADGKSVSYGFVSGPYFIWKTVPVPGR